MSSEDAPLPPSSSHRLPTVSASQALQNLHVSGARAVSTGLEQLDKILAPATLPGYDVLGGYMRGKVTEVFGPPGVGKTTFGIQAAASALRQGQHVVWIDGDCAPLVKQRFNKVLGTADNSPDYIVAPRLAHLLALLMHSPSSFPHQNTSLVVVDSLSTLIDNAYPRNSDDRIVKAKTEHSKWAAGRRFAVINELMAMFNRFAALHNVAVLLTSQTITRIRGASRALLTPAISGTEWEAGVFTRMVLFRDWIRSEIKGETADARRLQQTRFVGLVKANGIMLANEGGVGTVVPFTIEECGLRDVHVEVDDIKASVLHPMEEKLLKRPFAEVDENAEEDPSSDELYGWVEDDQVATEGLLVDEASVLEDDGITASPSPYPAHNRDKKAIRLSTA